MTETSDGGSVEHTPVIKTTDIKADIDTHGCYAQRRYVMIALLSFGMLVIHAMRVNVAITAVTILDSESADRVAGEHVSRHLPKINWHSTQIGLLHAIFYVGFLLTQIPGGYLCTVLPANRIFGASVLLSCSLNMVLPTTIQDDLFKMTCALRLFQGMSEGCIFPALYGLLKNWCAPSERTTLAALSLSGMYAGPIIGFPLDGAITHYTKWYYIYYLHALSGFVWFMFWFLLAYDKPEEHPGINNAEKSHIVSSREYEPTDVTIPWKAIFLSAPFWAVIICHFVRSWMYFLLLTNQPAYLNSFKFSILTNGFYSSLPHILKVLVVVISGGLADYILRRELIGKTATRKLFTSLGFGIEAVSCFVLTQISDGRVAVAVLSLGIGCSGLAVAGWQVNHLDLAPQFASVLVGISTTIGTLGGIVSPIVIGRMTHSQTLKNWQKSFFVTGSVMACGVLGFLAFGSGLIQPWAIASETKEAKSQNSVNEEKPDVDDK